MAGVPIRKWKDWLLAELFDDDSGVGRPVTILHVDDALFVRAASRGGVLLSEQEARERFLGAFPDRVKIQRWLTGSADPGDALAPFLVLCCLAASEAAEIDNNDYRRRLRDLMGWEQPISNCEALPFLWTRIGSLLRERGKMTPTRDLVLPDPRFRTQIGHAIELTFPSRNDTRRLLAELRRDLDMDSPVAVLEWLAPLITKKRFSPSFEETYYSFRDAWLAAERSLADHRFWCGWLLATRSLKIPLNEIPFEIMTDEWGCRHLVDPASEEPIDFGRQIRARLFPVALLLAATRAEIIELREVEWARLRWAGDHGFFRAPDALLVRRSAFGERYSSFDCVRVAGVDGWGLTYKVDLVLGKSRQGADERDRLLDASPIQCTRVDGGLLARPALPFIIETTGLVADVEFDGDIADQLKVQRISTQRWRVTPTVPVTGEVTLLATSIYGGVPFKRLLRLRGSVLVSRFRTDIPPHMIERDPLPSSRAGWPLSNDALPCENQVSRTLDLESSPNSALLDLIEFLAIRTLPIPLVAILDTIRTVLGRCDVNPWDVLRGLNDAGLISVLDVRGWQGSAVISRQPQGALMRTAENSWAMAFEGVLSESFMHRLEAAAQKAGLGFGVQYGVGQWSPPTPIVTAVTPMALEQLATVLDISFGRLARGLDSFDSLQTGQTITQTEHGRSVHPVAISGEHAPITLLLSDRSNVRPIWAVASQDRPRYWKNRDDAIIDAYSIARSRPFYRQGTLLKAQDARLPSQIARWLRLSHGIAAGPLEDQGYGYVWSGRVERELTRLAPHLLNTGMPRREPAAAPPTSKWKVMAVQQPLGSVVMPLWHKLRHQRGGSSY